MKGERNEETMVFRHGDFVLRCRPGADAHGTSTSRGNWHFVNNQTGGAAAGHLDATWDSGDTCSVDTSLRNAQTQHFNCTACGELTSASTNLPGKLVLSDFSCQKKEEPPPCDPKTEKCP
jgi:hypothetical protein